MQCGKKANFIKLRNFNFEAIHKQILSANNFGKLSCLPFFNLLPGTFETICLSSPFYPISLMILDFPFLFYVTASQAALLHTHYRFLCLAVLLNN